VLDDDCLDVMAPRGWRDDRSGLWSLNDIAIPSRTWCRPGARATDGTMEPKKLQENTRVVSKKFADKHTKQYNGLYRKFALALA